MKLTIFTPTYNRAFKLPELYESILTAAKNVEQDEIEWLIVDDGSTDNTAENVKSLIDCNELGIRYFFKGNGGKHTAFNYAIDKCDGDLFVCIDDDDKPTPNSLSDIFAIAKRFAKQSVGAIVGRVVNTEGVPLGRTCFKDTLISNTIEIRDKYHFWGEPEVYYVKYLKKYRFDVFGDEKFLTEAYLFDEMSQVYPFVYTNTVMMVKEFLPGGLTDNATKIRISSPQGTVRYYDLRFKRSKGFFPKMKAAINRRRFNYWNKNRYVYKKSLFSFIAVPFARLMYFKDRRGVKK